MRATEILSREHRVIEQVLDCIVEMARLAERERKLDPDAARQAVYFFRTFADSCHHAKEEAELFPAMERRGFSPQMGPTAVMRSEHEQGRRLVGRIEASIDAAARGHALALEEFAEATRRYECLLRAHIEKEDHCLFPMADQALDAAEQLALVERFDEVERRDPQAGTHERCLRIADELARRFEVAGCGPGERL